MMDVEKFEREILPDLQIMTPNMVADMLREAGITGRARDCEWCPIAAWLRHVTGAQWSNAGPAWLLYGDANPTPGLARLIIKTPESIREFMVRFDAGDYPDLED